MVASSSPLLQPAVPHVHVTGEHCPWCDQPIPHEKFEEITGRIEARERERFAEVTRTLKEQHVRDKAQAEAKAKADLEQARRAGAAEIERVKAEAAAKEAAARADERAAAENRMQARIVEIERTAAAAQAMMQAQVTAAEQRKKTAEQAGAELKRQLEELRTEKAAEIQRLKAIAAANETAARADERTKTLAAAQAQVTEAQLGRKAAEAELQSLKDSREVALNTRLAEQREALEKDKINALNAKDAEHFKETQKHTARLAELQRQLEKKTADELGEGAEIDLFEDLKAEFRGDLIEQLTKREGGADIKHCVMHNGKECGLIVYDSKDRNAWRNEYVDKLARDQRAAKAEYAILSTRKFPADTSQIHLDDGVIIANPARVLVLVQIIRKHMVHVHALRLSNTERAKKTAALYDFITSKRCVQLLDAIDTHAQNLLALQEKEIRAHESSWKQQGTLYRSIQKVRADLGLEIERIIGTAEDEQ
jgi:hypothetical protein